MTMPNTVASLRSIDASEASTGNPLGLTCRRVLRAQSLVRAISHIAMSAEAGALGDVLNLADLAVIELGEIHGELDEIELLQP